MPLVRGHVISHGQENGFGADEDTLDITLDPPVTSLGKAFARSTGVLNGAAGRDDEVGSHNNDDLGATVELTATDTVQLKRYSGGVNEDHRVFYEVWDFDAFLGDNEVEVQFIEEITLADGVSSADSSNNIASGTDGEVVPFICGVRNDSGTTDYARANCKVDIVSTPQLKFRVTRGGSTGETKVVIACVHFKGSNWSVQKVAQDWASAPTDVTKTVSITDVSDWENAFIVGTYQQDSFAIKDIGLVFYPSSNTDEIKITRHSTHNDAASIETISYIVSNSLISVQHDDSIDGSAANLDSNNSQTYSISAINYEYSAVIAYQFRNGNGVNYARCHDGYKVNPTNVTRWKGASGTTGELAYQVINFEKCVVGPPDRLRPMGLAETDPARQIAEETENEALDKWQ